MNTPIYRRRSVIAGTVFMAMFTAAIAPSIAAEGDPTLDVVAMDDLVVASGKSFAENASVEVEAEVDGGSGIATITTSADGRFVVAFQTPDGFTGDVTITAEGVSESTAVGTDEATTPTPPKPATTPDADDTETTPVKNADTNATPSSGTGDWLSGASGMGVDDMSGSFGTWRGSEVEIASTWADSGDSNQRGVPTLTSNFAKWNGNLDIAVGALVEGDSWGAAAGGAYDDRWTDSLNNMKSAWAGRDGTLYIRFAHEMNGNWYPWSVKAADKENFKIAWKRYRALQQDIFPDSQLVFNVNRESVETGFNWTESFPGAEYVDVMGVDYYNQYPYVKDQAGWEETMLQTDAQGAPKGLQAHLDFAKSVGLPLSLGEWNDNMSLGDSPVFFQNMYAFFQKNAGSGPGQILYEVVFNHDKEHGGWRLTTNPMAPGAAAAYRDVF